MNEYILSLHWVASTLTGIGNVLSRYGIAAQGNPRAHHGHDDEFEWRWDRGKTALQVVISYGLLSSGVSVDMRNSDGSRIWVDGRMGKGWSYGLMRRTGLFHEGVFAELQEQIAALPPAPNDFDASTAHRIIHVIAAFFAKLPTEQRAA